MHIPRTEGPNPQGTHFDGPRRPESVAQPGLPIGNAANVARQSSPATGDLPKPATHADSTLFREFSDRDVLKLMDVVSRTSSQTAAPAVPELPKLVDAVKEVSVAHVNLSPVSVPPTSAHVEMDETANAMHAARFRAEARLAEAEGVLSQPHPAHLPDWDAPPEALLRVSQDLYNQGDYMNYLRSGEVAQALLDGLRMPIVLPDEPIVEDEQEARSTVWRERVERARQPFSRPWWLAFFIAVAAALLYLLLR